MPLREISPDSGVSTESIRRLIGGKREEVFKRSSPSTGLICHRTTDHYSRRWLTWECPPIPCHSRILRDWLEMRFIVIATAGGFVWTAVPTGSSG